MAKAVPSMTARTSCLRWVERLKPQKNTPRKAIVDGLEFAGKIRKKQQAIAPRRRLFRFTRQLLERFIQRRSPFGMVGIQQIGNPVHGASACHHRAAHERQASNDVRKRQQAGIKMWFDCGHIDGGRRAQRKQSVLGR